jgi:hypothetical protein
LQRASSTLFLPLPLFHPPILLSLAENFNELTYAESDADQSLLPTAKIIIFDGDKLMSMRST